MINEIYIKHKEYDKYGSIIDGIFYTHKWIKQNEDLYKKRLEFNIKNPDKINKKSLCIGEFIHKDPIIVDSEFFNSYMIIPKSEYLKCLMLDYNKI